MSLKELYEPVLDRMWVRVFRFRPWEPKENQVVFNEVNIVRAVAYKEGIYVESDEHDPFHREITLKGYIDTITSDWEWGWVFRVSRQGQGRILQAYERIESRVVS